MEDNKEQKEFREGRFDFALYVNDNLICKRNFYINYFIEESMQSLDFKILIDKIVAMIDEDLTSKSRIWTWYNAWYDCEDAEPLTHDDLKQPLLEPGECTFKFVVYDNKREVISKIWDGRGYPRAIRERVDIANKVVKIATKDGKVYTYDKNEYFEERGDRLSSEMAVVKAMIMDRQDLLLAITKEICNCCSQKENGHQVKDDYILADIYRNVDYERNEDGSIKLDGGGQPIFKRDKKGGKKYCFGPSRLEHKLASELSTQEISKKSKEYFSKLF